MKNIAAIFICAFVLVGCATPEPVPEVPPEETNIPQAQKSDIPRAAKPKLGRAVVLDVEEVERKLNLGQQFDQLGFHEKRFSPCVIGYQGSNCDPQYFTMINFKVECRSSEGTVQSSDYDLSPYSMKALVLKVGANKSETQTDAEGFASMKFISKKSVRTSMFVLSSPPDSFGLRAGEVKKVMVPDDWCH